MLERLLSGLRPSKQPQQEKSDEVLCHLAEFAQDHLMAAYAIWTKQYKPQCYGRVLLELWEANLEEAGGDHEVAKVHLDPFNTYELWLKQRQTLLLGRQNNCAGKFRYLWYWLQGAKAMGSSVSMWRKSSTPKRNHQDVLGRSDITQRNAL